MVLVLVIGDLHIPHRCHDLPAKFKKLLVPGKIQQILLTGNVCDHETYDYLRSVAPDVRSVRGDWDETIHSTPFPPSLVVQHGSLRIGVMHGHQAVPFGDSEALSAIARKMDVDVMVSGGTHRFEAFEFESRFFVNPGSATGAFLASTPFSAVPPQKGSDNRPSPPSPIPSFVLLDIQGNVIVSYVYQLVDGDVRVEKIEHRVQTRS